MSVQSCLIYSSHKVETMHQKRGIHQKSESIKKWECPSADDWIKKTLYVYTMEHYSAQKRNEVPIHDATWGTLNENIILNKRNQTSKVIHCMIPFTWDLQDRQIHRDKLVFAIGFWGKRSEWRGCSWLQGFFLEWWKYPGIVYWWWFYKFKSILKSSELYTFC